MKLCAACSQELPKENFSKKQWQLKSQRRCKECIAVDREVSTVEASLSSADGEGVSDEDLFKEPPPRDECPICMLPRPLNNGETSYFSCCGKTLCDGCIHGVRRLDDRVLCPFCRTPAPTSSRDFIERLKRRVDANDSDAMRLLGSYYRDGLMGLRQNMRKANKLWLRAGELGDANAYHNVGVSYEKGLGVERDTKKAKYYYELAAMGGDLDSRHNLGVLEKRDGKFDRAIKHLMISARAGDDGSLKEIRECFLKGHVTKDDFEKALRAHKEASDMMKSDDREAAKQQ